MWTEDLVAKLSPKASQVLLSLLLARKSETQYSQAEFAQRTGLHPRSVGGALSELEAFGLIHIIQQPGRPALVRLVNPQEYYETHVEETDPETLPSAERPLLEAGVQPPTTDRTEERNSEPSDQVLPVEPLEQARLADEHQNRQEQVAALQAVWDVAFPEQDYPYQRLQDEAAKRLLANGRSAAWVGQIILDAKSHATGKINSPRGYVEAAIRNAEKRKQDEPPPAEEVITDELRDLVRKMEQRRGNLHTQT